MKHMVSNEILERSPLRVFERAIGGGLGQGHIGVVLSRRGVGKTGFMIGVAIDTLLQGKKVLHISTKEPVERVRGFYDQIFKNLADDLDLDQRTQRHLEMERNRHILVYNRKFFSLEKLENSVGFLRDAADFSPSLVIMDGTPRFEKTEQWEMEGLVRLATEWNAEIWTSSHMHREGQQINEDGIPEEVARFSNYLPVILLLEPTADRIRLRILRDRGREDIADLQMELDPNKMLLRWR
jgi:hypothetical protein